MRAEEQAPHPRARPAARPLSPHTSHSHTHTHTPPSAAFTALFVAVANSALPEDRAKVNGLGQAAVSVVRAVGPPLVTPLFAWSVSPWNNSFGFPLNYGFCWLLMAAMAWGAYLFARTLPPWLERKRLRTDAA